MVKIGESWLDGVYTDDLVLPTVSIPLVHSHRWL